VQAAKTATDTLMKVVQEKGSLPEGDAPKVTENGVAYYTAVAGQDAAEVVHNFFAQARPGDFLNIQAYLTESGALNESLLQLRTQVQEQLHLATTSGYGPRFLHSTGQYHKGGPDKGLFVQFTQDHPQGVDLPLPGRSYSFGTFKNAQAAGDLQALRDYSRRTLRIHLGADAEQGLRTVLAALQVAPLKGQA
jgi:transaldolase/glucose-6-phosphate isomerase